MKKRPLNCLPQSQRNSKVVKIMALYVWLSMVSKCHCDFQVKVNYGDSSFSTIGGNFVGKSSVNLLPLKYSTERSHILKGDVGFIHAFVASMSVILVSELGDKTFFIAAIMAMRHSRLNVFAGAMAALGLMTVLSAVFGMAATVIPGVYTYWISTSLFAIFGLKMLKEGYYMTAIEEQEELEEVQCDLKKREDELVIETLATTDVESGISRKTKERSAACVYSRTFVQAFTMTFLAEWGDRSQLTTIILSAREDIMGVIAGGILGHSFCTGLAVIGGRILAQKISVRTVTIVGGVVFILFAASALFFNHEKK